jgi:hypothetical protein
VACRVVLGAGELGAVSWRLGFWWLAGVGLILAIAVATMLREPARGGRSRGVAQVSVAANGADAIAVLHKPVQRRSLWSDVRYVLSIRTNVVLVVGSSFGYFSSLPYSSFRHCSWITWRWRSRSWLRSGWAV